MTKHTEERFRRQADKASEGPVHYHDASHGPECHLKGWYTYIRCLADGCESLVPWPSDITGTAAYFCPPHRAPYGA